MLQIQKFVFSSFYENTYLIWDEESKETMIVDAGCSDAGEEDELKKYISNNKLELKYLVTTHCHIDHVFGNAFIKENYSPEFWVSKKDVILLDNLQYQANMFGLKINPSPKPDNYLTEQTELTLGDHKARFLFTPGHSPGEYCIYFEKENFCMTGDVLFREGIGRTDLLGGNYDTLINSIEMKLMILPGNVIIYPGHGEESTIGYEKQYNPFLNSTKV
jgi:glyoxylase-like metal-dependent hydrolase (beta-lactamase superfamily II)